VITNSWAPLGSTCGTSLCTAINGAATAGRGGLGAVVLFAMSNSKVDDCIGPNPDISSLPNVIAVSRSTNRDRFNSGGFGNCMDVLAPTHGGTLWIPSTDLQGAPGYNNTSTLPTCPEPAPPPANARDYTLCFDGSSAAAPLAAGTSALLLTVNQGLTRLQVQRLLQDTADKIEDSAGTYSTTTGFSTPASGTATHGYGRVNALEAVRVAAPVTQGGRGGRDLVIRDNRLDWGNTEQPSNQLFEATRGFIPHWESVDIRVDVPPLQPAPTTSAAFDALVDENPVSGQLNKVYVRVRNRGPNAVSTATVKLHWAFAGAGLPNLPGDFWTRFPLDSTDPTTRWTSLGTRTITNLAYSGTSVAGTAGDAAQIVSFDFPGPPIDPMQPVPNHFCLFAVIDSPDDPISPVSRTLFFPDVITPQDNNITQRNVRVEKSIRKKRFVEKFFAGNPTEHQISAALQLSAPKRWRFTLDKFGFGRRFVLQPHEQVLITMKVRSPKRGARAEATVMEVMRDLETRKVVRGGMTYVFRP
jgi:hypothetical protein